MVGGIVDTVDCHIRVLVHDSYRELVGPDTWFSAAFTGLLTIYIALLGYQLLFGRGGVRVTELPFTAVKIGLILAFLTSWAAYQTVVFNLLFEGPADLMRVLLRPLQMQGSGFDGDVMAGLERAFDDMSAAAGVYGEMASPTANILQGGPMLGSGLLWLSSISLLLVTLGVIVAAKIVLAFLLAIGPVFIGFLLFETTRGLFEGWLRATFSFALAPMAVTVFGASLIMILQPFLEILVENARIRMFDMGVVITLSLIIAVFAIVMMFGLSAVSGIARGLRTDAARRPDGGSGLRQDFSVSDPGALIGERAEQMAARIAIHDRQSGSLADPSYREREIRYPARGPDGGYSEGGPAGRLGEAYRRIPRAGFDRWGAR
jgi:type IV secretion system protein VirB6